MPHFTSSLKIHVTPPIWCCVRAESLEFLATGNLYGYFYFIFMSCLRYPYDKNQKLSFPRWFGKLSQFCELHFWFCLLIGSLPVPRGIWTLGFWGRMYIPAPSGGMVLFGQSHGRLFLTWSCGRGLGCVVHLCRAGAVVSLGSTLWSPPGRHVQGLLPGAEPAW